MSFLKLLQLGDVDQRAGSTWSYQWWNACVTFTYVVVHMKTVTSCLLIFLIPLINICGINAGIIGQIIFIKRLSKFVKYQIKFVWRQSSLFDVKWNSHGIKLISYDVKPNWYDVNWNLHDVKSSWYDAKSNSSYVKSVLIEAYVWSQIKFVIHQFKQTRYKSRKDSTIRKVSYGTCSQLNHN